MALLAPGHEFLPFPLRRRFSVTLGLIILCLVVHPDRLHSTPTEPDPDEAGKAATADLPTGVRGGFPVGYRVLEIEVPDRAGRTTTIPVAVWYPTVDRERKHKYPVGRKPSPPGLR